MKKVININFQGRVLMIEEAAYDQLKAYIESLRRHFAEEEGHEEIINDIESRISELFAEVIKKGSACVTEEDLAAIIDSIGRPEDFVEDDLADAALGSEAGSRKQTDESQKQKTGSTSFAEAAAKTKQLFRDENNKKIGGVCAGIAHFFGIDPTIVRLIALVLLVCYGTGLLLYIILWIAVPSSAIQVIGSSKKKLFRDISNKTLGGVAAGLASYFDVSIWVPKVIFIAGTLFSFPFVVFSNRHLGGFFFPGLNSFFIALYIILWIVVPPAITASDRLSMKGESVDLNNIKSSVQEDLQDGKKKVVNRPQTSETVMVGASNSSGLGDFLILICKIFAYFILGSVLLSILGGLILLGVMIFGLAPLREYFLIGYWQNFYGWAAVILLVWVPVLAIIIWIIRRLMKAKSSKALRIGFVVLLILGVLSSGLFTRSIYKDFRYVNQPSATEVALDSPQVDKLDIQLIRRPSFLEQRRNWIWNGFFLRFDQWDPETSVNNVNLEIRKASTDSFSVTLTRLSNGASVMDADMRAAAIPVKPIIQNGAHIEIPCDIVIDKANKFRNQNVILTVYVPEGKKIELHTNRRASGRFYVQLLDEDFDSWDDERMRQDMLHPKYSWRFDKEYLMTSNGLELAHPDLETRKHRIESSKERIEQEKNKIKQEQETIRKSLEEDRKKMQESLEKQQKELEQKSKKLEELSSGSEAVSTLAPLPTAILGKSLLRFS